MKIKYLYLESFFVHIVNMQFKHCLIVQLYLIYSKTIYKNILLFLIDSNVNNNSSSLRITTAPIQYKYA